MKICLRCGDDFPTKIQVDGKVRNLQRRQHCLTCNPFQSGRKTPPKGIPDGHRHCPRCDQVRPRTEFYSRRREPGASAYCKDCTNRQTVERHVALKKAAVRHLGGECVLCGYSKCIGALEFHHKDPNEKDFTISKIRSRTLDRVKEELSKCALVCANCHREVHAGLVVLPK